MSFPNQVYATMLNNLLLGITPALPRGSTGTRPPVGTPEHIPDITFITRELRASDGIEAAEMRRMNGYIRDAITYHKTYGLIPDTPAASNPRIIDSFEDILNHFHGTTDPIGRVRLVSHGNNSLIFMPIFENGLWNVGLTPDRIAAFTDQDAPGVRLALTGNPTESPVLLDASTEIFNGIRANNPNLLTPFGLNSSGTPTGNIALFIDLVNDYYQLEHGTIFVFDTTPMRLINTAEKRILETSLGILEDQIRTDMGTGLATALTNLKDQTLLLSPVQMDFLTSSAAINLTATDITNINNAVAASPQVLGDLRNAFPAGSLPFFGFTGGHIQTLSIFNPSRLQLGGGVTITNLASVQAIPDLEAYFEICSDLFNLRHNNVTVDGSPANATQRSAIRNCMLAIADLLANSIVAGGSGITAGRLTRLRDAIEGLSIRQSSLIGGNRSYSRTFIRSLVPMNDSLTSNPSFRTRFDHFKSLMRTTSHCDVRGCFVGQSIPFLDGFRRYLGTSSNLPNVTAPDWLQSFPAFRSEFSSLPPPTASISIYDRIDELVQNGSGVTMTIPDTNPVQTARISAADVTASFNRWKGLIDFDPHYSFISSLFSTGASQIFDFVTLEWRIWRTSGSSVGIPILKMEAERIDDIVGLDLGDIIVRFGILFNLPSAARPAPGVRTRLNALQPHVLNFKNVRTAVSAATTPSRTELTGFFDQLTAISNGITGIDRITPPPSPLVPSTVPSTLTLSIINGFIPNFQTYIDSLLNTDLNGFFTAIRTQLTNANAEIRYCLSIGIPVLIQSSTHPSLCSLTILMHGSNSAERTRFMSNAHKSWMKIQWQGTTAQAAAMNTLIDGLTLTTNAQKMNARRASLLSEEEIPTTAVVINPLPEFQSHIIPNTP